MTDEEIRVLDNASKRARNCGLDVHLFADAAEQMRRHYGGTEEGTEAEGICKAMAKAGKLAKQAEQNIRQQMEAMPAFAEWNEMVRLDVLGDLAN